MSANDGPRHRLFGTDGARGVAGVDLTPELAVQIGRAATMRVQKERPKVLIITDTRSSRHTLQSAVAAGVTAAGGNAHLAGVLPTPAAPLLVLRGRFDLAVVITASHNPHQDNGIKLFGADGLKLNDRAEDEIEAGLAAIVRPARFGVLRYYKEQARTGYLDALEQHFEGLDLGGLNVLLDCANGATSQVAPEIFRSLGAHVETLGDKPNGTNINDGCGAAATSLLQARMRDGEHHIGIALDGDGDRVVAVDRYGRVLDGDELLALHALHLQKLGRLPEHGVAVTVMSNLGFDLAMREAGIQVARTEVGDRNVLEKLLQEGWRLGGEQSGHIIYRDVGPSGDGIAAALLTLAALGTRDLSEVRPISRVPQKVVNVDAGDRGSAASAMSDPSLQGTIARERVALADRGLALVRPSGTEALIRVMVQAPSQEETDRVCAWLVRAVKQALARST